MIHGARTTATRAGWLLPSSIRRSAREAAPFFPISWRSRRSVVERSRSCDHGQLEAANEEDGQAHQQQSGRGEPAKHRLLVQMGQPVEAAGPEDERGDGLDRHQVRQEQQERAPAGPVQAVRQTDAAGA